MADAWHPSSYYEPFLGGAAMFLHAAWPNPTLGDLNDELIQCYAGIASDPKYVATRLRQLNVDRATFDRIRRSRPRSQPSAAVRMLYLNRCAYGGIYRVNRAGEFNTPFSGDKRMEHVTRPGLLTAVGEAISSAELRSGDFADTLATAREGALVFCDPTYALPEAETDFRRYTAEPFRWSDQLRLADQVRTLGTAGALIVVTNSSDERVESLYRGCEVVRVTRRSPFPASFRKDVKESVYLVGDAWCDSLRRTLVEALP